MPWYSSLNCSSLTGTPFTFSAAGSVDNSFRGGFANAQPLPRLLFFMDSSVVAPDGKIYLAGYNDFYAKGNTASQLLRFNTDGTLNVINPFLDPAKRTARVRIDIPNPDFKLRPGMYMNAELAMQMGEGLTIPASAVMPTGSRNIVFVDKDGGKLEPRVVQLGVKYGDSYQVQSGLQENERVVNSANFLIDAESKVQGALNDFETDDTASPAAKQ